MIFQISYDFTSVYTPRDGSPKVYSYYPNNLVGKCEGLPIGYGPVGPAAPFTLEEIPLVMKTLREQLQTTPTLHITPLYYQEDE